MKDLVEFLSKSLVDDPSQVKVEENGDGSEIVYQISVAPNDMGKIIGKQGRVAKALRSVVKAAATKQSVRVQVDIVD